jgi:S-adenosylmethionine synthetase
LPDAKSIELFVNTQDQYRNNRNEPRPSRAYYLVATGGALDFGEEGFVGRGNNRHGIIPSTRSYTMEAPYGKNPKYHAGKVLAVVSDAISEEIEKAFGGAVEVWIMPNNSDKLLEPSFIAVNTSVDVQRSEIETIIDQVLTKTDWTDMIIFNTLFVPKTGNLMRK